MQERASTPEELPPTTPEMVLIRVFVCAFLKTAHLKPRLRASAFVREASNILATEESVALLFPIRPTPMQDEVAHARRQAVAIYRQYLPTFLACLPKGMEED